MKDGIKLKGKLATYMRWPFILTILLVAMDVLLYSVSWKAGGIGTVFTAVYLLLGILLYFHRRPVLLNELISFATQYGQVQKSLMKNFALPYALLDAEGKILWMNADGERSEVPSLYRKYFSGGDNEQTSVAGGSKRF